jgi:integrase/recombinase XerD
MNQITCVLDSLIDHYLQRQRALGRGYNAEERILKSLCQFLQDRCIKDLDSAGFDAWCQTFVQLTANVRRYRQRTVRNFCLYRYRTDPSCFVPDINRFPRPTPYIAPVIFGSTEVSRMLEAADQMRPSPNSPLRPAVMRLAIVLLYTAGLRRGELVRLILGDVDSSRGVLRIRESKFHKSRFVPLSTSARKEVRHFLIERSRPPLTVTVDSPLLCNFSRGFRGYTGTGLSGGIHTLFQAANVHDSDGRRPRVHDFRHSFAVQALLRWYHEGADVQSNLPKLAMYMGHVSIVSTAYYLKLIPEITEAASQRFESHFGYLIDGGLI